jgi:hypothetical protein
MVVSNLSFALASMRITYFRHYRLQNVFERILLDRLPEKQLGSSTKRDTRRGHHFPRSPLYTSKCALVVSPALRPKRAQLASLFIWQRQI